MRTSWLKNWLSHGSSQSRRINVGKRCRLGLECLEDRTVPATITVTSIADNVAVDGQVTLREAILSANGNSNVNADVVAVGAYGDGINLLSDVINFNIPGVGTRSITPASPGLPTITGKTTIDGYSQPGASVNTQAVGSNAVLRIEVNGISAGNGGAIGFDFQSGADGSILRGLIVNRFGSNTGVRIAANSVSVNGNFIGTNDAGTSAAENRIGILVQGGGNQIGSGDVADRNVISGNLNGGISLENRTTLTNTIQNNYIGVDKTGIVKLANRNTGIILNSIFNATATGATLIGGPNAGQGNVISGNDLEGIDFISGDNYSQGPVTIQGNIVGLGADGTAMLGNGTSGIDLVTSLNSTNGSVLIGGNTAGQRNIISGNTTGITYSSSNTLIQGNYIGTDITGTLDRGNTILGIEVLGDRRDQNNPAATVLQLGGTGQGEGNVISGNDNWGVKIRNANATIQGNLIGTQANGTSPLGNRGVGIEIISIGSPLVSVLIGGTTQGAGNVIANNTVGLNLRDSSISVLGNSIYNNFGIPPSPAANRGIDISAPNNDPMDVDTGPNGRQNYPLITSVNSGAGSTSIQGTFNSTPNTNGYRLEFFANPTRDASGFDEGKVYLGFTTVNTDASGNTTFSVNFPVTLASGQSVTVTATNPQNQTSEFSRSFPVAVAVAPDLQVSASDGVASATAGSMLTYTLTYSNSSTQAATGVVLTENLPAGTTFNAGASTSGWAETSPGSGVYRLTIGNVAATSGPLTARFVVTVNNPVPPAQTQIINTASIADDGSHGADPTPANNSSTDTDSITATTSDVEVTQTVSTATTPVGAQVTFRITVRNNGNSPATEIHLTDMLPTNVSFVSFTVPNGWTKTVPAAGSTGTVTASKSTMAAGESASFDLVLKVNSDVIAGTIIQNTVGASTTSNDNNLDNNVSNASTEVVAVPASNRFTYTLIGRIANYRSEVGLYFTDDASGRIGNLKPGDQGYAKAAIARTQASFSRFAAIGSTITVVVPEGKYVGWYLAQNSTASAVLAVNPFNRMHRSANLFFSFRAANADRFEHVKYLDANTFGLEDQTNGGDRDYNDIIIRRSQSASVRR